MTTHIIFIADLHLNDAEPEVYQRFSHFLRDHARHADALYILGDLFEYYLGDDALTGVTQRVCQDLKTLQQDHQTDCYFISGNRDFLLGKDFANGAKLTLLDNQSLITLENNQQLLLCHGDELCTDDIEYQKIRSQLRSTQWQQWFLTQSIQERIAFAKQAREKSQQHTSTTDSAIMDVNAQAVTDTFIRYNCQLMLHGHTHRPAFHQTEIDNKSHQRMVVGDWHYQTSFIEYKNNHFQLLCY